MISLARLTLDRAEAGLDVSSELAAVPAAQWDVYFPELLRVCPDRREMGVERRPANALNLEIGAPQARCLQRAPDGRGLAWLWSGGELLAYGCCDRGGCPRRSPKGGAS